ncbi:MAG: divalent metal cation transporter, partial [Cellvibrionales bacterium]|nr:divalent metal cation transporter [Cellvibrionales bacterium]
WMSVLFFGATFASMGYKPINIILLAQVTNGILLPLVTLFLIWVMNSQRLAEYKNGLRENFLAVMVLLVTLLLGGKTFLSLFFS